MATRTQQLADCGNWRPNPENLIGVRINFSRMLRAMSSDLRFPANRAHAEKMAEKLAESLAKHFEVVEGNQEKSLDAEQVA